MDPSSPYQGPGSREEKRPFVVLGASIFVALLVLGGGLYLIGKRALEQDETGVPKETQTPYGGRIAHIGERSDAYRDAVAARQRGEYARALERYEQALAQVSTDEERAQIEYEIALVYNRMRSDAEAIRALKNLVANEKYPNILRAYAAQLMGQIFYNKHEKRTFDLIFVGEPYSSFLVPGDAEASLNNLFEYASSFYPLMYAELRIANWYANQLLRIERGGGNRTELSVSQIKDLIRQKIANADRDIEQVKAVYPVDARISNWLQRKAVVLDKMMRLGDSSFGDPEPLFKEALEKAMVWGLYDQAAYTIYHYAVYLARVHPERTSDVRSLLRQLYGVDSPYTGSIFFDFLRNEKENISGARGDVVTLANLDPQFKELLVTLGWSF